MSARKNRLWSSTQHASCHEKTPYFLTVLHLWRGHLFPWFSLSSVMNMGKIGLKCLTLLSLGPVVEFILQR